MRHFRSILYALALAPAAWILAGAGLTRDLTTQGRGDSAVESATGPVLLLLAGVAYGILVLAPISPAGPSLAGLVFLGVAGWALTAPSAYAGVWPPEVAKEGLDLSRPGYGLAALLAAPLIGTALSARRWARYEPPVLPLIGQLGRAHGAAAVAGTPVAMLETEELDISGTAATAKSTTVPDGGTDPEPAEVLRVPAASDGAGRDAEVTTALGKPGTAADDEVTTALGKPGTAADDEVTTALGEAGANKGPAGDGSPVRADGSKGEPSPDRSAADEKPSGGGEPAAADEPAAVAAPDEPATVAAPDKPAAAPDEPASVAVPDERAAGEESTRSLTAPDPDRTRVIPLRRPTPDAARDEPPAEITRSLHAPDPETTRDLRAAEEAATHDLGRPDEETTRASTAPDPERTRDLSGRVPDPDQTQVLRGQLPGAPTDAIPVPRTGDVGGDETQVIRMPGRPGDQERTQVIRPGPVAPPGERGQDVRDPASDPRDTEPGTTTPGTTTPGRTTPGTTFGPRSSKTRPKSIADAEQPDFGEDPTSPIVPPAAGHDAADGEATSRKRGTTVTNMERPPDEIAGDTTRTDIPAPRRPTSDES